MLKIITITIALIGLSCAVPALAQSQNEEGTLNFSMGGGFTIPMNPIARFAGVGGSFLASGGLNLDQHNSIVGQFMWNGLPPTVGAIAQLIGISKSVNLDSLTADYKYRTRFGKTVGAYVIMGGGWYYRNANISRSVFINTATVCQPVYGYYGYTCSDGYVNTVGVSTGTSSFGANGGIGLEFKISKEWKFFMESRYVYAASRAIATQVTPVIFGFEFQ
jgi:hypothetical protein